MRKIVFVGVHNKPGLGALCSTTKTGKWVDAVIDRLKVLGIQNSVIKSNLFDLDYLPSDRQHEKEKYVVEWVKRVDFNCSWDVAVSLGNEVNKCLRCTTGRTIRNELLIRHPGRYSEKELWVETTAFLIANLINGYAHK